MRPTDPFYFFAFILLISGATQAAPRQNIPEPARTPIAALLELQRSGKLASAQQQTLPGPAQTRAWQRYIDSFATPIPARYIDDSFKSR